MEARAELNGTYAQSEDVVARDVAGELVIVPLTAGIGDLEDDLFSLNETGKAIWQYLDGRRSLSGVIQALQDDYDAPASEIETDVIGIVQELLKRGIVVEVTNA